MKSIDNEIIKSTSEKAINSFFWKPEMPLTLRLEKVLILNKRFFKKRNKRKIKKQISRFNEKEGGIVLPITMWKFETLDAETVACTYYQYQINEQDIK